MHDGKGREQRMRQKGIAGLMARNLSRSGGQQRNIMLRARKSGQRTEQTSEISQ